MLQILDTRVGVIGSAKMKGVISSVKIGRSDPVRLSFARTCFVVGILIGNVCSSVIVHDEGIHIAVKPMPQQPEESIDGGTSHRVAELLAGGLYTGPYFDPFTTADISVQVGSNAILPCRVRQAGNRSVSWVRKGDGHLLAVGDDTFINDGRFQAHKIAASDTWTLQIRAVQPADAGDYECQVSSNEPKISRIVHLRPVEPIVDIKGAPDMYVKNGSPVTLHCQISSFLISPTHVEWRHNGSLLAQVKNHQYHPKGNGESNWIVGAITDDEGRTTVLARVGNDSLQLTLALPSVSPEDSGQYLCLPSNMAPVSASLHVVIGEHPAAMQHGDNGRDRPSSQLAIVICSVFISLLSLAISDYWRCFHILSRPSQ
ncbi:Dpr15-like protein [Daphnia magna]|uniref:Defective proboscis extension response n=1 Tax=Daphnia magna TaxID=35525 RepID=A0A0N7ZNX6_9CRUS|nr:Dpr15-like protein [Daphnia magna]